MSDTTSNLIEIVISVVLLGAFVYGMAWLHDHGCLPRTAKPNSVGLSAQIDAQIEAAWAAGCPLVRKSNLPSMRK